MAAVAVVAVSAQSSAQAAPKLTLSQAKAELAADRQAADAAANQYDTAQGSAQALQQKVSILQDEVAEQQAVINKELVQLGAVAAAQYRTGSVDPEVQLMLSSDPAGFLDDASAQGEVDATQQAELGQFKEQQAILAREKAEATAELAQQQALLQTMQNAKSAGLAKIKAAQSLVQSLTPAQQEQVNGGGLGGPGPGTAGGCGNDCGGDLGYDGSLNKGQIDLSGISSQAATAMEAAMGVMGDFYHWAYAGPTQFDCSGLVMWAYAHAGITLPHSAAGDASEGTAVDSLADAKVGDIIVLDGYQHVGLYAGNGMLLNAPTTGWVVELMPLSDFGPIDAIRRM
jgi:cell wall-associated NlpC family hydrolase